MIQEIAPHRENEKLAFFDAIAPIIYKDSIDFSKAWKQSRYDKGEAADYINCPLSEEEYAGFIKNLLAAEQNKFHDFKKNTPYFEKCLPKEGLQTLFADPPRTNYLSDMLHKIWCIKLT